MVLLLLEVSDGTVADVDSALDLVGPRRTPEGRAVAAWSGLW
jgi:hypothetical protein